MSEIYWSEAALDEVANAAGLTLGHCSRVWNYLEYKLTTDQWRYTHRTRRYRSIIAYWAMIKTRKGPDV